MIWCVEDDTNILDLEMCALEYGGFKTKGFEDGKSLFEALKKEKPKMIILDVMLPNMDGIEILRKLKESIEYKDIAVIMATAKGQEYDKVKGLNLGADDYIVKPFGMLELVARVNAVLRRTNPIKEVTTKKYKDLILNLEEYTVTIDSQFINLTYKEFELLNLFMSHPGRVYSKEQLFIQVWKQDYMKDSRTLDSHISSLRQKIKEYGNMIETIRNVGYKWRNDYDK